MSLIVKDSVERAMHDLESGMQTGDATDGETIYVFMKKATVGGKKALLLQMMWVPFDMRRQGVCKRILDALERRADRENVLLAVGPIMADENDNSFLGDLCAKRGYAPCMPFSYVRTK